MRVHGSANITKERTVLNAYFVSPSCLEKEGKRELRRRHLAVNLSKHCALDHYGSRRGSYAAHLTALCMKEGKPFRVNVLAGMQTLTVRSDHHRRSPPSFLDTSVDRGTGATEMRQQRL